MFFHICPVFEERPYFGLTMFFCICPACLSAEQERKERNFITLFCTFHSMNTNEIDKRKTMKRKYFYVKLFEFQEGQFFGRTSNIVNTVNIPWVGLTMLQFWTHHATVLDWLAQ